MPHVPRMLPFLVSDPVMRQKVEDTFTSQEFMDNLESYFVDNIKVIYLKASGFLDEKASKDELQEREIGRAHV